MEQMLPQKELTLSNTLIGKLLASIAAKRYISVIEVTQLVVRCYGNPGRLTQGTWNHSISVWICKWFT